MCYVSLTIPHYSDSVFPCPLLSIVYWGQHLINAKSKFSLVGKASFRAGYKDFVTVLFLIAKMLVLLFRFVAEATKILKVVKGGQYLLDSSHYGYNHRTKLRGTNLLVSTK